MLSYPHCHRHRHVAAVDGCHHEMELTTEMHLRTSTHRFDCDITMRGVRNQVFVYVRHLLDQFMLAFPVIVYRRCKVHPVELAG